MKLNAYTIYDSKAACAPRPPFFLGADGEATRLFKDLCMNADTDIGKHPEDYTLHRIGVYDNVTMELVKETPDCLYTGVQAVSESRQVNGDALRAVDNVVSPGGTS